MERYPDERFPEAGLGPPQLKLGSSVYFSRPVKLTSAEREAAGPVQGELSISECWVWHVPGRRRVLLLTRDERRWISLSGVIEVLAQRQSPAFGGGPGAGGADPKPRPIIGCVGRMCAANRKCG